MVQAQRESAAVATTIALTLGRGFVSALEVAVATAVNFSIFSCGGSANSPSCKGSNSVFAKPSGRNPPADAKDPTGSKAPGKPGLRKDSMIHPEESNGDRPKMANGVGLTIKVMYGFRQAREEQRMEVPIGMCKRAAAT